MQKKIFFLLWIMLPFAVMYGQNYADAVRIMDSCVKKVKDINTYKSTIEYDSQNFSGRATLLFSDGKYRFTTSDVVRMCDGKYIYTIMNDIKEVNVENIDTDGGALGSMSDILNIFVRNFKPYTATRKNDSWFIEMRPVAQDRELESVEIEVDINTLLPLSFVEKMRDGNGSVIKIIELTPVVKIQESEFYFDEKKYKESGYYIVRP